MCVCVCLFVCVCVCVCVCPCYTHAYTILHGNMEKEEGIISVAVDHSISVSVSGSF